MALFSKNWFGYQVSQGEPLIVNWINRAVKFVGGGNRNVEVFKIDGDTGAVLLKGPGSSVKATVPAFGAIRFVTGVVAGLAAPGSVVLANAKVGDKVILVSDTSSTSSLSADFETTITVAGHIQQTAGGDISAHTHILILLAQQS